MSGFNYWEIFGLPQDINDEWPLFSTDPLDLELINIEGDEDFEELIKEVIHLDDKTFLNKEDEKD